MAHQTDNPANKVRWICLYMPYIDSKCSASQGRRIAVSKAVPEPTPEEVWQVVKDPQGPIGLPWAFERDKAYSRDFWRRGRFRFQLKDENKGLLKPNIPNRLTLFEMIAKGIIEYRNSDAGKQAEEAKRAKQAEDARKAAAEGGAPAASASGGSGGGGGGKKGKKKNR